MLSADLTNFTQTSLSIRAVFLLITNNTFCRSEYACLVNVYICMLLSLHLIYVTYKILKKA